jgi:serine protease Do
MGAGSGFIIDKTGYILTNNHVVEGAMEIEVWLAGMNELERGFSAKVVGTDILTDSALLQMTELPDHPLTASKFGDSATIAPGDWVMAIGNPFQLSNTVTVGVVSAVGRQQQTAGCQPFEEMIQTDAAINRGNSGGPLLNIRGEVVGMNTQIVSDGGGNLGIGFAVPINTIRNVLPQLMKGKVTRGRIGVFVDRTPMTKADAEDLGLSSATGALVTKLEDGPAQKAGMRIGDVILDFNGKPVKDSGELVAMVSATAPGTTVPVKVMRAKKALTLNVTIEELNLDTERDSPAPEVAPGLKPDEPTETQFGFSVEALTANRARRLNLPSGTGGAIVSDVDPAGAAARGGIAPGDVITEINGQKVTSLDQVTKALSGLGRSHGENRRVPRRQGSAGARSQALRHADCYLQGGGCASAHPPPFSFPGLGCARASRARTGCRSRNPPRSSNRGSSQRRRCRWQAKRCSSARSNTFGSMASPTSSSTFITGQTP